MRASMISILLGLCLTIGCSTSADDDDDSAGGATDDDDARPRKALVLGIDGVRGDAVQQASTPHLDGLLPTAAYSFDARTHMGAITSSGPGWTSFFTGVDADKHGVWSNGEYGDMDEAYPSYLARAKEAAAVRTTLAYQWLDIGAGIVDPAAVDGAWWSGDEDITTWTAEAIAAGGHDLYTVVLDDVDHAGHDHGFSPDSAAYLAAISTADGQLGQLLEAIEPRRTDEDWLVIVSTDHGGDGDEGHGAQNDACQTIFLVVAGDSVQAGELPAVETRHLDIHPTVLAFFGVPIDPAWDLDGTVRGVAAPGD
jgi:predicted AlkP superfamily pyrophosphatase or phosphodiesterase